MPYASPSRDPTVFSKGTYSCGSPVRSRFSMVLRLPCVVSEAVAGSATTSLEPGITFMVLEAMPLKSNGRRDGGGAPSSRRTGQAVSELRVSTSLSRGGCERKGGALLY